jgi:DNA-directed RNA polymerase subunit H (RpoH/RPB5)
MQQKKTPYDMLCLGLSRSFNGRITGQSIVLKCYMTVNEMLADRGVTLVNVCDSSEELMRRVNNNKPVIYGENVNDGTITVVFFDTEERTGIKYVRQLKEEYANNHMIIVNIHGVTPFTKKEVSEEDGISTWMFKELIENVTHHALVPKHRGLSDEEARGVAKELCVLEDQWPVITFNDPIRRYMGFKKGQIIEIHRKGVSSEASLHYRKVV